MFAGLCVGKFGLHSPATSVTATLIGAGLRAMPGFPKLLLQSLTHGTREMPVWGDTFMQGVTSRDSPDFSSKEMAEAIVRQRILALVEYISTLQDENRESR